mgnify:CR=1 FL=1
MRNDMKKIIEILQEELSTAFEKAGYDKKYAKETVSNRPDLCQYQCNGALAAAKEYHKAPIQMANEFVAILENSDTFAQITAQMPGFINIVVSEQFLADYINGDTYYKIKYPEHNLVRTKAQFKLLQSVEEHTPEMVAFINECLVNG